MKLWIKKHQRWIKRIIITIVICICFFFIGHYAFIQMTNAPKIQTPGVSELRGSDTKATYDEIFIMSINMAHGRANGAHQLKQSTAAMKINLDNIADFVSQESPDIVAVQEADQKAFWSGSFNHLEHVAKGAGYPYFLNGAHMQGLGLHYGTGIMSKINANDHLVYTFDTSFPTPSKGFTLYQVKLGDKLVDIISLHLDYAKTSVRQKQKDEIVTLLKKRGNSCIVIGDVNSNWHKKRSTVKAIVDELDLTTHDPESKEIVTFPRFKSRIDWILISKDLQMTDFKVHELAISDHYAISAKISLATEPVMK